MKYVEHEDFWLPNTAHYRKFLEVLFAGWMMDDMCAPITNPKGMSLKPIKHAIVNPQFL